MFSLKLGLKGNDYCREQERREKFTHKIKCKIFRVLLLLHEQAEVVEDPLAVEDVIKPWEKFKNISVKMTKKKMRFLFGTFQHSYDNSDIRKVYKFGGWAKEASIAKLQYGIDWLWEWIVFGNTQENEENEEQNEKKINPSAILSASFPILSKSFNSSISVSSPFLVQSKNTSKRMERKDEWEDVSYLRSSILDGWFHQHRFKNYLLLPVSLLTFSALLYVIWLSFAVNQKLSCLEIWTLHRFWEYECPIIERDL